MDKQGPTVVHQKPGHLQTIFGLPPDEASNYLIGFVHRSNTRVSNFQELLCPCFCLSGC
jgi:hypothetical protein